jgi:transposase
MFYRLRNPGPWRDLPTCYGKWRTIYGWYRLHARDGLWLRMLKTFTKKQQRLVVLVDGTHVLAHQSAARTSDAAQQAMGKTRGGRNTKIMALTDARGRLVSFKLIEGQAYEGAHVIDLLPAAQTCLVIGDKGFDSDKLRAELEALGHGHCFPGKSNRKIKVIYSKKRYRERYKVENFFCRLKSWASANLRRDKLALHFSSMIAFAAVIDWMRQS